LQIVICDFALCKIVLEISAPSGEYCETKYPSVFDLVTRNEQLKAVKNDILHILSLM